MVDSTPIPFAKFIDTYAMKMGYSQPAHISLFTALAKIIIKEPQMETLDISTRVSSARAREQHNWSPNYGSYDASLDRTLSVWQQARGD